MINPDDPRLSIHRQAELQVFGPGASGDRPKTLRTNFKVSRTEEQGLPPCPREDQLSSHTLVKS